MTALATPPKLQFFDSNGNPLAGGKLHTYAAGTTTPLATYTDYGGGTPNANPVILDSRGEANVWLSTALYKFNLTTSTNVDVWTVDNVGGMATLAQLAASGGSALVGYLPAGTGAVATTVQAAIRALEAGSGGGGGGGGGDAASVTYTPAGTGAVPTTVQAKLRESVSVLDYMTSTQLSDVKAGTALVDVSDAFIKAGVASLSVRVPRYKYLVNNPVSVLDNQCWMFENAELIHTDDTKHILRADSKSNWSILGKVKLTGTRTGVSSAVESGLYISGGKKFLVEGVEANNFKGKGIWLDGPNPSGLRGDRGQFSNCATYNCTTGRQIDIGAEYSTWTNFNAGGCAVADKQAGGNVVTIGGNIVDNTVGVQLIAGANHLHGLHVAVNVNHNATYNVEATAVVNGHDFIGCHIYGSGSSTGAIFLNQCKGIVFNGGHLDCWIYNYTGGGTSGFNYIRDMYCPGSYGAIERFDFSSNVPTELIISNCYGAGAYKAGVAINDPGQIYSTAKRLGSAVQSLTSLVYTALIFDSVPTEGNRRQKYNAATGVFECPSDAAGWYRITANVVFGGTSLSASNSYADVVISGSSAIAIPLSVFQTTFIAGVMNADVYLTGTTTVQIKALISGTSPTFGKSGYDSYFSVQRIG